MSSYPPFEFLMANATRLPFFIVYIVGFVLALTMWRRHPRASLLSLIAFLLFFLSSAMAVGMNWYVMVMRSGMWTGQLSMWLSASSVVNSAISIAAWILMLFALVARRTYQPDWSANNEERYPHQYPGRDAPPGLSSQDIRK